MKNEHGLTPQAEAFAQAIASGLDNSDAYRRAYPASLKWKPDSVWNKAAKLANDARVRARVTALQAQIAERTVLNQADVRNALAAILRANPAKLILRDKEGRAKFFLPDEVDSETAAAVAAVEIDDLGRIKYKFWDKNSAAATAARMLGMFEKDNAQKGNAVAALLDRLSGSVYEPVSGEVPTRSATFEPGMAEDDDDA